MHNGLIHMFISMTMAALTYSVNSFMCVHARVYATYPHIIKKANLGA